MYGTNSRICSQPSPSFRTCLNAQPCLKLQLWRVVIVPPKKLPANCQSPTLVVCKHRQPCLFWTRPSRINMKPDPTEPGLDFLLQTRQSDAWRILIAGWAEPTFHPWSLNLILERWSLARDSDEPEGKSWNHKRTVSTWNRTLKLASISSLTCHQIVSGNGFTTHTPACVFVSVRKISCEPWKDLNEASTNNWCRSTTTWFKP